jgi:hypothetical protein
MYGKTTGELPVCDDAYRPLCRKVLELEFQLSMSLSQNVVLRSQLDPGFLRHGEFSCHPQ